MKKNNLFLQTFAGEFLEIITDIKVIQTLTIGSEGETVEGPEMPMIVNGFLMDCDDLFAYLSTTGEEVNQCIPIDSIKHVQIVDIKNEIDEMLDSIPDPDPGSTFN